MSENQNAQNTNVTDDFELPGVPDAFQRLWTPHRTAYVSGGQQDHTEKTCPFCTAPSRSDEESLIVYRGEHTLLYSTCTPIIRGICSSARTATFLCTTRQPKKKPSKWRA